MSVSKVTIATFLLVAALLAPNLAQAASSVAASNGAGITKASYRTSAVHQPKHKKNQRLKHVAQRDHRMANLIVLAVALRSWK